MRINMMMLMTMTMSLMMMLIVGAIYTLLVYSHHSQEACSALLPGWDVLGCLGLDLGTVEVFGFNQCFVVL